MARTINDLYNLYQYIVRKERGVFVTAAQFTQNLDAGQLDAFEEWFKLYGANQEIHDALRPFRVYQLFTSDSAGAVSYQDDYLHLIGSPFLVIGSSASLIHFVNEDELPFALSSQLRPVSDSYPIAVDSSVGFSIYPQQVLSGAYFYLRRPATPVLAFNQVGRVITYNSGGSTQLEWNEVYVNNIIAKALKFSGINMDEDKVYAFAEQYDKESK